jgi:hypothetical protein
MSLGVAATAPRQTTWPNARRQLCTDFDTTHFERSESFECELVLIGRAFEYLPYFVLSFRELAESGLGLNRARCTLDQVVTDFSLFRTDYWSGTDFRM